MMSILINDLVILRKDSIQQADTHLQIRGTADSICLLSFRWRHLFEQSKLELAFSFSSPFKE